MKYRRLKKYLKNKYCHLEGYFFCLEFQKKYKKFWFNSKKRRNKPQRKYDIVCYGDYDSYTGEQEEWQLYTNKELQEFLQTHKDLRLNIKE